MGWYHYHLIEANLLGNSFGANLSKHGLYSNKTPKFTLTNQIQYIPHCDDSDWRTDYSHQLFPVLLPCERGQSFVRMHYGKRWPIVVHCLAVYRNYTEAVSPECKRSGVTQYEQAHSVHARWKHIDKLL